MKRRNKIILALGALAFIGGLALASGPVSATAQFTKDTGKKCAFCHVGAPKDGKLTKEGECFKKNGNKQGTCW